MSELRHDPIQGRWVIIATDRSRRPHDLQTFAQGPEEARFCPFCPGNELRTPPEITAAGRPSGGANGPGWQVRVVPNKYPALSIEGDLAPRAVGMYDCMRGIGAHEVVIDTPEHAADLGTLPPAHLQRLLGVFQERVQDLYRDLRFQYVLVFKNHGAAAGATLAHPHTQIIATPIIPRIVGQELHHARAHFQNKNRCLFCDVLSEEIRSGKRIIHQDDDFVVFAPYASRFPFELMILPVRHRHDFTQATAAELQALAVCLGKVGVMLRNVLENPPFNLVIHTAPNTQAVAARRHEWHTLAQDYHWHLELLPRLTHVAGFETGTDLYINPTAPEEAARFLRQAQEKSSPGRGIA